MSSSIFRKAALERLSSPEQLDIIMRITGPRRWLALAGAFLILGAAVVWGYAGTIDSKITGEGVIMRAGTVLTVVTSGAGLVTGVSVSLGEQVKAHQVVGTVSEPEILEKIRLEREAIDEARAMRARSQSMRQQGAQLQVEALARDEANAQREIQEFQEQAKITAEQIKVDEQLLAKGLITRQQTLQDQQKLVEMNGEVESRRAKIKRIDADRYTARTDPQHFDEEMKTRVAELERSLAGLEQELEMNSSVVSPYAGQVIELKVEPGSVVAAGAPILTIQPEGKSLGVLVYVSSRQAKSIQTGMPVEISPSTVSREEYGYMRGDVVYVGEFPASTEALMRNFQNEPLVRSIMAGGPVTELRVRIENDPNARSGFAWSSSRGPDVKISVYGRGGHAPADARQPPFPILERQIGIELIPWPPASPLPSRTPPPSGRSTCRGATV